MKIVQVVKATDFEVVALFDDGSVWRKDVQMDIGNDPMSLPLLKGWSDWRIDTRFKFKSLKKATDV